jgi:hypothetical protein
MNNPREFITDKTDVADQFRKGDPCYGEVNLNGTTLQWYGEDYPNNLNNIFRIVTKVYVENEEKTTNTESIYSNSDEISEEKALKILRDNGGWNYLE